MTPRHTVEAIYAAFQRGDIPFIVDQLAPDVFWRLPASVPWAEQRPDCSGGGRVVYAATAG